MELVKKAVIFLAVLLAGMCGAASIFAQPAVSIMSPAETRCAIIDSDHELEIIDECHNKRDDEVNISEIDRFLPTEKMIKMWDEVRICVEQFAQSVREPAEFGELKFYTVRSLNEKGLFLCHLEILANGDLDSSYCGGLYLIREKTILMVPKLKNREIMHEFVHALGVPQSAHDEMVFEICTLTFPSRPLGKS